MPLKTGKGERTATPTQEARETVKLAKKRYQDVGKATVKAFEDADKNLNKQTVAELHAGIRYAAEITATMPHGMHITRVREIESLEEWQTWEETPESEGDDGVRSDWVSREYDKELAENLAGQTVGIEDMEIFIDQRVPEFAFDVREFDTSTPLPEPMVKFSALGKWLQIPLDDLMWTPAPAPEAEA